MKKMKTKTILLIIGLMLLILVSGCTETQQNNVGTPTGNETINNQSETGNTAETNTANDSTETDNNTGPQDDQETDNSGIVQPTPAGKLRSPYACDNSLVLSTFKTVFGNDITISKKPAPYGKTITYMTCNIIQKGAVIVQLEFHETTTLETALNSLEDEARQIDDQLFESTKETLDLGEKGYYFYSSRTGEHRIIFVDADPLQPVFLIIRSLPGTEIEESVVKNAAQTLEGLI
ncbi:MAG: hypothetical protein NUV57_03280 [archaeon]|nr:hypothetical protein [archaeon]